MGRLGKLFALGATLISLLAHATPEIGSSAPPITGGKILQTPAAATLDWSALHGKVVVIDFWATWCGPCLKAMPHWNKLVDAFSNAPVQFVAVTDENADVIKAFLKHNPIHGWVGVDDPNHSTRDLYGIEGIPTTIVVNQVGKIVAITHPASLEPKHIEEVLLTQKSSLPPPDRHPTTSTSDDTKANTVALPKPLFQILVRNSDPHPGHGYGVDFWTRWTDDGAITGQWASIHRAIVTLFDSREILLDNRTKLPENDYNHDFTVRLPGLSADERDNIIATMFRTTFGLKIHREQSERDIYVLKFVSTNAPGLVLSTPQSSRGGGPEAGGLKLGTTEIRFTVNYLEDWLHKPVIDESGLTNQYDVRLKWKMSRAELLPETLGSRFFAALEKPDAKLEEKLSPDLRRLFDAYRGKLSDADLQKLSSEDRETLAALRAEMAKPEDRRFDPDPDAIITAIRDQWGLALTQERRQMPIIVVEK